MKVAVFIPVFFLISLVHAQEINYRLNLKEGQTFMMEYHSRTEIEQKLEGNMQKAGVISYFGLKAKVSSSRNDTLSLECNYTHLKVESNSPGLEFIIDSDAGLSMSDLVASELTYIKFGLRLTTEGKVLDVKGFDEELESLLNSIPGEGIPDTHIDALKSTYGHSALFHAIQSCLPPYPVYPVSKEETWTDINLTKISGIEFNSVNSNNLRDIQKTYSIIQTNSFLQSITTEDLKDSGPDGIFSLNGNGIAEYRVDRKTGLPTEVNGTSFTRGRLVVDLNGEEPKPIIIPMILAHKKKLLISGI